MARLRSATRAGMLLVGLLLGAILLLLFGVPLYFREAGEERVRQALMQRIDLPGEAFEIERIRPDRTLDAVLRDVRMVDRQGALVLSAEEVQLRMDVRTLEGDGPIEIGSVLVREPVLNLVERPDGTWNLNEVFAVEAGGEPIGGAEEVGRGFILRDVRIADGSARIATAWDPADTASLLAPPPDARVRVAGRPMQVRTLEAIDARLPMVRFGGDRSWRVELATATARLRDPEIRLAARDGWLEERGEGFRFALEELRTGSTRVSGSGDVRLAGDAPAYDVRLRADPLSFRDLQWMLPGLPDEGTARFALHMETLAAGRTAWRFTDAEVATADSRAFGRLTVVTAEDAPPTFLDTRITLDPLQLATLRELGLVEELPYTGQVVGTISSAEAIQGPEGSLYVDLSAAIDPVGFPGVPTSVVAARGGIGFGPGEEGVRFEDLRLEFDPFHVAALSPLMETGRERLRGVARGSALLSGSLADLRVSGGVLAYEVGDAPTTRLRLTEARIVRDPELRFDVAARAEPLALQTLRELFPALPVAPALLTGPIRVSGTAANVAFRADLESAAGGIAFQGTLRPGDPLRFDLSGTVEAFSPGELLLARVPVEGPLTGSFAARGTSADLRFDVDLAQGGGRFALAGRYRAAGEYPQVDVTGRVDSFRIGMLVGNPGMLPSPVTGTLAVSGGGRQPYAFDVDLRGEFGGVDLEGRFVPADVPRYTVSGSVAGLDVGGLPGLEQLPRTVLTGDVRVDGRGTTLETFAGDVYFAVTGPSSVGGVPIDAAVADVTAAGGVLAVRTFEVAMRGMRLEATGRLGLTEALPADLQFSFTARDLTPLAAVIPPPGPLEPRLGGSVAMSGVVSGSLRDPRVSVTGRAANLRYEEWAAGSLTLEASGSQVAGAWTGQLTLQGSDLLLPGGESLQALRLEANATPEVASFGLFARRNAASDLTASGRFEFTDGQLRGALLESLDLRAGDTSWELATPSLIRWGGIDGIAVRDLRLIRSGQADGLIAIDGRIPPTGVADLRVSVRGVDLAELRRIAQRGPEVAGTVNLEAVLEGPVGSPEMSLDLRVDSVLYEGFAAEYVTLRGRYADEILVLDSLDVRIEGRNVVRGEASIPMVLSLEGGLPSMELRESGPLSALLVADSVPMELIAAASPGLSDGTGVVAGELRVAGTLQDPSTRGWLGVSGASVRVDTLNQTFERIEGRVTFDGELIRIDSLVAWSGGRAALDGTIQLTPGAAPTLYLVAAFEEFHVIDQPRVADLGISGRVALTGPATRPAVSGRVVLDEGTIFVPEFGEDAEPEFLADLDDEGGGAAGAPAAAGLLGPVSIQQLTIVVEDDVWIVSEDLRVQIRGELFVNEVGGLPQIYGGLETVRGTYMLTAGLLQREFEIERGRIDFLGTLDLNPSLEIVAAHEVRTLAAERGTGSRLRILVTITGTLEEPRISLTSATQPPLPEEELYSYLIFGRPSFALGTETTQLAQQILVERLFAGYLAGSLERGITGTGLPVDYVRVRTGPADAIATGGGGVLGLGATTIELGTEIWEGFFFTVELGSMFTGFTVGFGIEWQIDPQWSVRGGREVARPDRRFQSTADNLRYQWALDLFWRREFGHPRNVEGANVPPEASVLPGVEVDPRIPPPPVTVPEPDASAPSPEPPEEEPLVPLAPPPTGNPGQSPGPGESAATGGS